MRRNTSFGSPRPQRGQAFLWFIAMLAACAATLALVYNVGQVANEKEKTINAADAAAYSGAVVEARMLNFMAYTNRSIVTNETTIAQIVSLSSWIQYNDQILQNANTILRWIPYVGPVINSIAQASDKFVQDILPQIERGAVYLLEGQRILLKGQLALVPVWLPLGANDMAQKVAAANKLDSETTAPELHSSSAAFNSALWLKFRSDHFDDYRDRVAQTVLDSRDQFSIYRRDNPFEFSLGVVGTEKTSGSTILKDYDHWEAQDSLDFWSCGFTGCSSDVGLAWGRAELNKNGTHDGSPWRSSSLCSDYYYYGGCYLAWLYAKGIKGWSGIPTLTDIKNGKPTGDSEEKRLGPTLPYIVAVTKAPGKSLTMQRIGTGMNTVEVQGPMGSPHLKDNLLGDRDQIAAIGAAKVFFSRPYGSKTRDRTAGNLLRKDGVQEYANLYNPYWQARLADLKLAKVTGVPVRTLLYAALGQAGMDCAADPTSCLP